MKTRVRNYWNTEKPIQNFSMNTLEGMGFYTDRLNSGKVKTFTGHYVQLCKDGTPDVFSQRKCPHGCCGCSQVVRIEAKVMDKKAKANQLERMAELTEAGSHCFVVDREEEMYRIKEIIKSL